ncbi:MAG TPA: DMT family transporter [Caulobacteraceae bacterium]|nr:DMT family transporter [Caulobacteraceae bacterium]
MSPTLIASVMVLVSGAFHAVVNAIFKAGGDKMSSRALIDGASGLIVLPAAFLLPLPAHAWGWLAGSGLTHLVYLFALVRAFEGADMMVAYPVFRGVAPVLAAVTAVGLFHEPMGPPVAAGVALVSAGVLTTALGRHMDRATLGWSLLTGASIALYTVLDAQGVRAAPTAPSYIAWAFIIDGFVIGGLFAAIRGRIFIETARLQWRWSVVGGAASIVTYGLALWAFRLGATPRLAALRETSILFAVVIAIVFLKERATPPRLAGVALIAVGALVLVASR